MGKASKPTKVKVVQLAHADGLALPAYQTTGSAGLDLMAAIPASEALILNPGKRELVPTGLIFELPDGTEAQVRPRSGLAWKHGVTVLNSPGTIDSDYRGEVKVMLINLGDAPFKIERGERIAQIIIADVVRAKLKKKKRVTKTKRGAGGFGSTGIVAIKTAAAAPRSKTLLTAKPRGATRTARPKR
jgi:dUTP pyrophosphatase